MNSVLWVAATEAAAAERAPVPPVFGGVAGGSLVNVLLALVGVIAIIALFAWTLRRFGPIRAGGRGAVQILGGVSLSQRERIVLVQVGGEQLLVGVAPGTIRTLHVLRAPAELVESGDARSAESGFAGRLVEALRQKVAS